MSRKNKSKKLIKAMCKNQAAIANSESQAHRAAEIEANDAEAKKAADIAAKKEKEMVRIKEARDKRLLEADRVEASNAASQRSKKYQPKLKLYSCTRCTDKFKDISGIKRHQAVHMKSIADKKRSETCTKCGNWYPSKEKRKGKHVCPAMHFSSNSSGRNDDTDNPDYDAEADDNSEVSDDNDGADYSGEDDGADYSGEDDGASYSGEDDGADYSGEDDGASYSDEDDGDEYE